MNNSWFAHCSESREWDLTRRDNSVPKKWQRVIIFLTNNYHTIAEN